MGVARRWVFPIIWMVIFAVIAAALVKISFFPDAAAAGGDGAVPTGEIVEPQVPAMIGTIRNDVVLDGTVNADAAIPVKATLAGEVRKVLATQGQAVTPETQLFTIRSETITPEGTPSVKTVTVTAGATGVLSSFSVLPGQMVAVGESVGQVAPPTFNVTATLAPEQQYRLLAQPTEATVTVTGGPAGFTCTGLTITTPLAGAGSGTGDGENPSVGSGTTVRCAVPADVTVFPGLTAQLTIAGGIAENVIILPMTAVEGAAGQGVVYVVLPDGSSEERAVTLGLNDGVNVEITGGLEEGELVLQFVPGAPAQPGIDGMPVDGGVIIEGK